ncbi:glycosyltransferase [Photobacterium leiognathi]|uniref:glycosyltransferase n=1 Tax=Photobacterium leiognathi TaxID=553611 RepID=UPI002980E31B|nr:glycosyltransferase [Photobacterium leiognathi]
MKIEFLISTYGKRINDIKLTDLPKKENVSYLIVVQQIDLSSFNNHLLRDDVRILLLSTIGVSKSRNYALKNAKSESEILIFMDDDIKFVDENLDLILDVYKNKEIKFATHQIINEKGNLRKKYINNKEQHNLFTILKYGTVEISVRHDFIKNNNILFNEKFGAGSELSACDEPIFLSDIIKKGGKGCHIRKNLFIHPDESNGLFSSNINSIMSRGAMFKVIYGRWLSIPLIMLFFIKQALKKRREKFKILKYLIKGYFRV